VPYGVGAPLTAGLDAAPGVDLVTDTPRRLIERLRAGALDAALVSSVEAFRRPGYRALAGLGICCNGAVRSVRAFRRRGTPIRTVGLDDGSESSVALLELLLEHRLGRPDCTFERVAPTLRPADFSHDLVLLIGDAGLRADPGDRDVLDLGALWHEWTGLPFVFALWLLPPAADPRTLAPVLHAAARAGEGGCADGTGGAVHYTVGRAELEGLRRFRDEAVRLGLAEPDVDVAFVDDRPGGGVALR
jgi:chorismate dehydratase